MIIFFMVIQGHFAVWICSRLVIKILVDLNWATKKSSTRERVIIQLRIHYYYINEWRRQEERREEVVGNLYKLISLNLCRNISCEKTALWEKFEFFSQLTSTALECLIMRFVWVCIAHVNVFIAETFPSAKRVLNKRRASLWWISNPH
jgi:hypothetical protein